MPTDEVLEVVKVYMAAWLEPDEGKRRRLLERSWTDDATYTDPLQHFVGREAFVQAAARFQQRLFIRRRVEAESAEALRRLKQVLESG